MKIKSLQMQGFKSFADRTELPFDITSDKNQVLGIVGPNGCGKSNIVDAIRWVMGEQSAKGLRGTEMADCIFNGTAQRKRASFAEVNLTFDNRDHSAAAPYTDCEEIMITRRLYRTGESEYLINKVQVRLKDIHDLFLGTGSSARAYSIVAQGKVDQVVMAKPEDRRFLLEEAAGVAKYKVRKQAAERKMEATRENLSRVDDIIRELERNSKYLERQVERAEQFRKLQSELRRLDEQIIGAKIKTLDQRADLNLQELNASRENLAKVAADLDHLQAEIEKWRLESLTQESLSASDYESLFREKERFATSDKEIELSRQRVSLLKNQIEERKKDIERLAAKALAQDSSVQQAEIEREELRKVRDEKVLEVQRLKEKVADIEHQIHVHDLEKLALQKELEERRTQVAREVQKTELYQSERIDLELRRAELERELENLQAQILKDEAQKAEKTFELDRWRSNRLQTEKQIQEWEAKHRQLLDDHENLLAERSSVSEGVRICQAELQHLQSLDEHEVGFDSGALAFKKQSSRPMILDLVRFKPEANRMAETFLKEWGQSFLFSNWDQTDDQPYRREIVANVPNNPSPNLMDYVESCEDEVLAGILRSIAVVDRVSEHPESVHPLIDLQGRFRAAFSGGLEIRAQGRIAPRETPFGRAAERRALEEKKSEFEAAKQHCDEKARILKDGIQESLMALEKSRAQLVEQNQGERELEASCSQLDAILSNLRQDVEHHQSTMSQIEERIRFLEVQVRETLTTQNQTSELEAKIFEAQEKADSLASVKQEAEALWIEQRISLGALNERLERMQEQADRVALTRSEYDHNRAAYQSDIQLWEQEIGREEARIQEMTAGQATAQSEIQGLEARLSETKTKLNRLRSDIEQSEVERKTLQKQKDEIQNVVQNLELKHQQLKFEVEELSQIVHERYHISLEELISQCTQEDYERLADETVLGALEVEARELREKLEKFGDVNLMALTEFEEIQKRLEFMQHQRADLLKTLDALQSIIDRVNRITEFRFRETFKAINHNFQILFPKLFGGGRAYMALTDDTNLLETGIEIFAEPPGKKIQAMSLLSGGEKAMTSISLLFALFAYRPASFCILDEVDAPLDEVNTIRYNSIIQEMSALSQFIVITHNKRTMEVADTLFGVTMPDPGVSQLVGVRLDEAKAFVASA